MGCRVQAAVGFCLLQTLWPTVLQRLGRLALGDEFLDWLPWVGEQGEAVHHGMCVRRERSIHHAKANWTRSGCLTCAALGPGK